MTNSNQESNIQAWLNHAVRLMPKAGRAFVLETHASGRVRIAARWPADAELSAELSGMARSSASVKTPVLNNKDSQLYVAQTLGFRPATVVMQLDDEQSNRNLVIHLLQWAITWLEMQDEQTERAPAAELTTLPGFLEAPDFQSALQSAAKDIAAHFQIPGVSIVHMHKRRPHTIGIAHGNSAASNGARIEDIKQTALSAINGDSFQSHSLQTTATPASAQVRMLQGSGHSLMYTISKAADSANGHYVFILECVSGVDDNSLTALQRYIDRVQPLLELHRLSVKPRWLRALKKLPENRLYWLAAAAAVLISAIPMQEHVRAKAMIESKTQHAVTAPFDGSFVESLVLAGDRLEKDQLLARMDNEALLREKRLRENELSEYEAAHRRAIARQNYAEAQIEQSRIQQAEAAIALVNHQIARSDIRSPVAGTVVSGNPSGLLGKQVDRGQLFFKISPDDHYILSLLVHERDIAQLKAGAIGEFSLNAPPGEALTFKVSSITGISEEDGQSSYFKAYARLDTPPASIRPGMQGDAKIKTGKKPVIWHLTHDIAHWLTLKVWKWLP
jgi:biotin carboxyl carrier protein